MANVLVRLLANRTLCATRKLSIPRNLSTFRNVTKTNGKYLWIIVGGVTAFTGAQILKENQVHALKLKREEEKPTKLTSRERRFIKFSSVEYNGQLYMTPLDFLASVVEQEPRPRLKRRNLTTQEVNQYMDSTPALEKGSKQMFRQLRDKGIISYTEYLFLLSVLTKPVSGFRIAFNMFDTDGNQRVDKNEFLVILKILGSAFKEHDIDEATRKVMERLFSGAWKEKHKPKKQEDGDNSSETSDNSVKSDKSDKSDKKINKKEDDLIDEGLIQRHKVDTTLLIHFFGKKGNKNLNYAGFYKFMDNLQTEVLELEFSEFSKGNDFITELDFAKILLRYTYLDTDEYDLYLDRLLERVKAEKGITFNEFRDFCRFLNNLEDFAIAMRMYTLADHAISKSEFSRAVLICTGYSLTKHLIDTVFAIFDEDGDGLLSYKEFIAIMKDRLHRGFRVSTGIFAYNDVPDKSNEPEYPLLFAWRNRICRYL